MPFRADLPCNDIPSPARRDAVETKAVLKVCIEARAAMAELRISGHHLNLGFCRVLSRESETRRPVPPPSLPSPSSHGLSGTLPGDF